MDLFRRALAALSPDRAETVGLTVLLASAVAATAALWWLSLPREPPPGRDPPASELVPTAAARPDVLVHVSGAVARPGVVRLRPGSRVLDALGAAGGPLASADLEALNLAREVGDGERVHVPIPGEAGGAGPEAAAGPAGGALDLNRATADDLEGLPGIGPVLAERILAWREQHGRFEVVGDLREIPGIGERTFQALADLVRV